MQTASRGTPLFAKAVSHQSLVALSLSRMIYINGRAVCGLRKEHRQLHRPTSASIILEVIDRSRSKLCENRSLVLPPKLRDSPRMCLALTGCAVIVAD